MENPLSTNSLTEQEEKDNALYWQVGQKLGTCMLHLYTNNIWTDVTFRCQDHAEDDKADRIRAHKIVLAARSPFFRGMVFGLGSENKTDFELLTTESETLDLLLRYIYSEESDLKEDNAVEVMALAHMFQIPCLVDYCANFLGSVLRPDNACEILELALRYNAPKLRDAACVSIDTNAKEVLDSDSFFGISITCLTYILKGDTFFEDETYIFNKAVEWSERQCSNNNEPVGGKAKRNKLGKAFYYLRLPSLGNQNFLKCTIGNDFYTVPEIENIFAAINDIKSNAIPCHSVVARVPRKKVIGVRSLAEQGYNSGLSRFGLLPTDSVVQTVECTLLAKVSRDCSISGFTLQNAEPFVIVKSKETSSGNCYEKDTTVEVPLEFILSVDDIFVRNKFPVWQNERMPFYLNKPIALYKKDTPYVINFKLRYKCEHSNIVLKAVPKRFYKDICQGATHLNTCLNKLRSANDIDICYCNSSKHVDCISSIMINNYSNRNLEEMCAE